MKTFKVGDVITHDYAKGRWRVVGKGNRGVDSYDCEPIDQAAIDQLDYYKNTSRSVEPTRIYAHFAAEYMHLSHAASIDPFGGMESLLSETFPIYDVGDLVRHSYAPGLWRIMEAVGYNNYEVEASSSKATEWLNDTNYGGRQRTRITFHAENMSLVSGGGTGIDPFGGMESLTETKMEPRLAEIISRVPLHVRRHIIRRALERYHKVPITDRQIDSNILVKDHDDIAGFNTWDPYFLSILADEFSSIGSARPQNMDPFGGMESIDPFGGDPRASTKHPGQPAWLDPLADAHYETGVDYVGASLDDIFGENLLDIEDINEFEQFLSDMESARPDLQDEADAYDAKHGAGAYDGVWDQAFDDAREIFKRTYGTRSWNARGEPMGEGISFPSGTDVYEVDISDASGNLRYARLYRGNSLTNARQIFDSTVSVPDYVQIPSTRTGEHLYLRITKSKPVALDAELIDMKVLGEQNESIDPFGGDQDKECKHPDHESGKSCKDRAVSCSPDCSCCNPDPKYPPYTRLDPDAEVRQWWDELNDDERVDLVRGKLGLGSPPPWLYKDWVEMTRDEKYRLRAYYRKYYGESIDSFDSEDAQDATDPMDPVYNLAKAEWDAADINTRKGWLASVDPDDGSHPPGVDAYSHMAAEYWDDLPPWIQSDIADMLSSDDFGSGLVGESMNLNEETIWNVRKGDCVHYSTTRAGCRIQNRAGTVKSITKDGDGVGACCVKIVVTDKETGEDFDLYPDQNDTVQIAQAADERPVDKDEATQNRAGPSSRKDRQDIIAGFGKPLECEKCGGTAGSTSGSGEHVIDGNSYFHCDKCGHVTNLDENMNENNGTRAKFLKMYYAQRRGEGPGAPRKVSSSLVDAVENGEDIKDLAESLTEGMPMGDEPQCPACGGQGQTLGGMGQLEWYRCRNCGLDFNSQGGVKGTEHESQMGEDHATLPPEGPVNDYDNAKMRDDADQDNSPEPPDSTDYASLKGHMNPESQPDGSTEYDRQSPMWKENQNEECSGPMKKKRKKRESTKEELDAVMQDLKDHLARKRRYSEVSPPGFGGTVKAMKGKKGINNPWALSWWMKQKGYKSHKKAD